MSEFRKWISERGSWEAVGPNVTAAVQYAKQHGGGDAVPVGVVGLCWGAQVSVHALKELSADVYGAVLIHPPARLDPAEIEVCARPLAVLPSKDEGDFSAIEATLKSNAHSKLNVYRKFDDMHHGWCGARADFENELNRQRTHEAVQLSVDFFRAAFA
ncbi:hypothetical protein BC828DRAFT_385780 [Blastocladiella britannica]|nr:hypothetical protein BC828DRAFT_385780 [Blastocladiella britannica]